MKCKLNMSMGLVLAAAVAAMGASAQQTDPASQQTPSSQPTGSGQQTGSGSQQTTGSQQTGAGSSQSGQMQQGSGSTNGSTAGGMNGNMQQDNASSSDKKFVQEAMQGSQAEIQLGQLAQQKASSQQVKDFGQKMVDDHTRFSEQMKPIAEQMGISTSASLPAKDQALQTKLSGLSGEEFDKAYMKAMVKDHQKDVAEFKKEARNGKSPAVKDAAQQGSQVIEQHLQMAEQIGQSVGAVGGNMTNKTGTNATSTPTGPQ